MKLFFKIAIGIIVAVLASICVFAVIIGKMFTGLIALIAIILGLITFFDR